MGFPWGFSGNTLIRRLCKSLLKKKLGDLILGDIDLDQLDVQLTKGTLNLSDLALNADFINEKLVGSAIMVKEGSMKSLSIKIPLKLKSCEIEVEEFELVLSPYILTEIPISRADCSTSSSNNQHNESSETHEKSGQKSTQYNPGASSRDVDEGVKRIANAVKWFLTSFHIRIKNIFVVFDPSTSSSVNKSAKNRSLVLRIKETEFGTCLSEDALVKLNNFVRFKEAAVEFLQLEYLEKSVNETRIPGQSCTTPVLTGPIGGFSGTLNLSIPWKNGSLSLQKLDADLSFDSLELNLQPKSIDWAINVWDSLQSNFMSQRNNVCKLADSASFLSKSFTVNPVKISKDIQTVQNEGEDDFLTRNHVIQNWVPESLDRGDQTDMDSDYDASVDQFFECIDWMRSSQVNLGSSGIWNWTCSVFNAITYATTLASGSDHLPAEQLTEKTLRASITEISVILSFRDQISITYSNKMEGNNSELYMSCISSMHTDQSTIPDIKMHHLESRFQGINLNLETYPQNLKLEASIGNISLDEYYEDYGTACNRTLLSPNLQRQIQDSLPPFAFSLPSPNLEPNLKYSDGFVKVELLKSFGKCNFHYSTSSKDVVLVSVSILLPPFIFWVHFHSIYMILNLINLVERSLDKNNTREKGDNSTKSLASKESLKGKIVFSPARVIVCFPSMLDRDFSRPYMSDKYIVFDHYSYLNTGEVSDIPLPYLATASTSIHIDMRNFDLYLVECDSKTETFSVIKILSGISETNENNSRVWMIWQKGSVTGPWMKDRAWSLSTLHDQKQTKRDMGKSTCFSSATSCEDLHKTCSAIRQELTLSTQFFLHIKLYHVAIHLPKKQYVLLHSLLTQVLDGFSSRREEGQSVSNDNSTLQNSVFLECGTLDFHAELDELIKVGPLLQKELAGLWNRLRLDIEKFELLSVSNVGGVRDARFLWVNHSEGKLWGSISKNDGNTPEASKDFLLVMCSNSALRRGNGDGVNALSFGTAGTSFTNIYNPNSFQSYISVIVNCGTLVAPGGRMDWIGSICSYFTLPPQEIENPDNNCMENTDSNSKSSFFLDLVDVALSYEPRAEKCIQESGTASVGPNCFFELDEESEKKYTACVLSAASLSLSNRSADYEIKLQDLGFLVSESAGSEIVAHGCHMDHLRQAGFAKIARNTLIEAVLSINGSFWRVDILDSSLNLNTCGDTMQGLIRLISQLQQLYAPDMQDALAHLQSRWNRTQQIVSTNLEKSDEFNENLQAGNEGSGSIGLLDEILENAFCLEDESGVSDSLFEPYVVDVLLESENSNSPEIIDTYYTPDLSLSSNLDQKHLINESLDRGNGWWYSDSSLTILEDHISEVNSQPGLENFDQERSQGVASCDTTESSLNLKGKIVLRNIDVIWRMYAGDDWLRPGLNPNPNPSCSSSSSGRDGSSCLEFTVSGLDVQYDIYPDKEILVSKLTVSARDLNLRDRSLDAPWQMVLGRYNSKDYPRESSSKAFRFELESIRPEPPTPLEDYRLQLEFWPLRLHLDQSQLNFLVNFFRNDSSKEESSLSHNTDEFENSSRDSSTATSQSQSVVEEALLPFFQKFDVRPLVVRVDYIPRQFDPVALSRGNYAELLNLVPWKGIDLKLKHVSAVGVYGWGSICETVLGEWLEDISHNQVHKLLKGLAPIRSLFAVSSGTSKLVSLPIKSYKKDRKLLKGMQRGAVAFIRSISIEAVGLGVHLAAGAHEILLKTECILTTMPPSLPSSDRSRRRKTNVRSNQPEDAQQGIQQQAYESMTEGLGRTASALIGTPLRVYQRGSGAGPALASAFRAAPAAAIAPVSASARAIHYALLGLRNSLDPEHKRESKEKYMGSSHS